VTSWTFGSATSILAVRENSGIRGSAIRAAAGNRSLAIAPHVTTFRREEWQAFFARIDEQVRNRVTADLCSALAESADLVESVVEPAIRSVREGLHDACLIAAVEQLVADTEREYEILVGKKDRQLNLADATVLAAFRRVRAATAICDAMRGRFAEMAYEAMHGFERPEQLTQIILESGNLILAAALPPPATPLLPDGFFGRLVSVIIGLFFGAVGGAASTALLLRPFERRLLVYYELSLAGFAFGVLLLLWGLFAPRWVKSVIQFVTMHFMLALCVIFLPIAFEFLLLVIDEIF
jgi:hypothetical protein